MTITLSDEQWERIGEAVDTLDNLRTSLTVMTGLPDKIHVEALRGGMPTPVSDLMAVIAEVESARAVDLVAADDSAAVVGIPELVRQGRDKWFALGEDGTRFNLVLTPTP